MVGYPLSIKRENGKKDIVLSKIMRFIIQKIIRYVMDNQLQLHILNILLKKGSSSSILCHLATYDVYTPLQPIRVSPTPFVFSIRAQDKSSIFEKESDYMRFLAVEDQEGMKDWVLSIRCTKVTHNLIHKKIDNLILFIEQYSVSVSP